MDSLLSVSPLVTGGCTPIQWTSPDGNPPPDRALPAIEYISNSLKAYATFLTVTGWITWAAILAVLLKYRKTKLLKASQPPMLALILLGNTPSSFSITDTLVQSHTYIHTFVAKACFMRIFVSHYPHPIWPPLKFAMLVSG